MLYFEVKPSVRLFLCSCMRFMRLLVTPMYRVFDLFERMYV